MTKKERKALAVVLYTLGEIRCDDPKYGEVITRLTDLLAGAEEEKEPNYVPTVPHPHSPWDWWEGFRPSMPGPGYPPPPIMAEGPTNQEQDQKASKWGGCVSLFPWILPHYEPPKDSGYTPWYTYVGPQPTDDHNQYVGGPAGKESEG